MVAILLMLFGLLLLVLVLAVLHGGVNDWPGGTVSFRRCGGSG